MKELEAVFMAHDNISYLRQMLQVNKPKLFGAVLS